MNSEARSSRWGRVLWAARVAQVRLRFVAMLAIAVIVVGEWEALRDRWASWFPPPARDAAMAPILADSEYFCPMDPGVLSEYPAKCSVCNMALVRRSRGDMSPLPSGVVARVQVSPEKILFAGIRTAEVAYRPLAKDAVPVADSEPFRSHPSGTPPRLPGEPRAYYSCGDHPEVVRLIPGSCPTDKSALTRRDVGERQRIAWRCPIHEAAVADRPGSSCPDCGGMELMPDVRDYRPAGEVLSVPDDAVIDTGMRKVAYVESMPGLFDGVEIVVGPRCDGFYPVISGLRPGQRVAARGAFLIDAETRLNPRLAAAYFGASRGRGEAPRREESSPRDDLAMLPSTDREAARRQKTCPVTGKALGSMGPPPRYEVGGRSVFACCSGCEDALRADPAKYLAKLPPAKGGP